MALPCTPSDLEPALIARIRDIGAKARVLRHMTAMRFGAGARANLRLSGIYGLDPRATAPADELADDLLNAAAWIEERDVDASVLAPLPVSTSVRDALIGGGFESASVEQVFTRSIGDGAPPLPAIVAPSGAELHALDPGSEERLDEVARTAFHGFAGAGRQPEAADAAARPRSSRGGSPTAPSRAHAWRPSE